MSTQGNPVVQVRAPADEVARWRAYAKAHGISLSTLVRDAVERRIFDANREAPGVVHPAAGVVHPAAGVVHPAKPKARRGGCSRSRFHRSGTYCRECGVVPA